MRAALMPLICLTFLLGTAAPVWAADSAPAAPKTAPAATSKAPKLLAKDIPILKEWQDRTGATVDYMGISHGMDAWISMRKGVMLIIYTTPDRKAMIVNNQMIGENGEDATAALQRDFVINNGARAEEILTALSTKMREPVSLKDASAGLEEPQKMGKSLQLWYDLTQAYSISFGSIDTPLLYVMVDLGCSHCVELWKNLQPMLDEKKIHVRLVPVAILGKESEDAAIRLLSNPSPENAWRNHVAGKEDTTQPTDAGRTAFKINQKIVTDYKLGTMPTLLYREPVKRSVRMVLGNPADLTVIWKDLGLDTDPAPAAPVHSSHAKSKAETKEAVEK